jgi:hypothetical protein
MARSPTLEVNGATRGKCEGVIGCTAGRQTISAVEVQLLAPQDHLLSSGIEAGEMGAA